MASDAKLKKESLERLKNQFQQATIDGNTHLAKLIKAIISRINSLN